MLGALLYLRLTSLKNVLLSRLRRLKQPKYLFGALVGAAYFYFIFFRHIGKSSKVSFIPPGGLPIAAMADFDLTATLGVVGAFVLLVIVLFTWAAPTEKPGLAFTEAEVAFLFPAPISRRKLIHFRLLGAQLRILISALFFTLVFRGWSFLGGNTLTHVLGWWLILTTLNLHFTGAALTITKLIDSGVSAWRRRLILISAVALIAIVSAISLWKNAPPFPAGNFGPGAFATWLAHVIDTGLLHWLLIPGKIVVAPFLAPDVGAFLRAAAPAVTLLIAHYLWVARQEVSFEEASIAYAEKRAARVARIRGGGSISATPAKARREPFRLRVPGRPELAFLWKNLLSTRPYFHWRVWTTSAAIIVIGVPWIVRHDENGAFAAVISVFAAIFIGYALMLGPQLARQDLRSDLPNSDILKTYPLAGWQVLLGETLTPVVILTGLIWLALLAAALALGPRAATVVWLTPSFRLTAGLCAAATVPVLCALQLIIPNAAALLFPAWFQATRQRGGGIDVMGQRLIFVFGQLIVILLALCPAVIGASLVIFATQWLIGASAAVILATILALTVLSAEVGCGLWWLGERFEKLDLATELRP
jgi:ABC-2 type transport system permease protein